jgi:hypothetical protein
MKKLCLLAVVFASLLMVKSSQGRIIIVPAEFATIQAGIDSSSNGDTVLVAPGTYHERINFNGHNIVLGSYFLTTGDTSNISSTIIVGDSVGPVVSIFNYEDSTTALVGFTIKHDRTSGSMAMGICCAYGAEPKISTNIITKNSSSHGGGIYCIHANPLIENNRIIENRAPGWAYGGGIYCEASNPIIRDNIIRGNYSGW